MNFKKEALLTVAQLQYVTNRIINSLNDYVAIMEFHLYTENDSLNLVAISNMFCVFSKKIECLYVLIFIFSCILFYFSSNTGLSSLIAEILKLVERQ